MLTPNPCALCGRRPTVTPWAPTRGFAAHCHQDLRTHAIECYGATIDEAVRRWNRLNPARRSFVRCRPRPLWWRIAHRLFRSSEDITLGL